jgi:hypothetical protein
MLEVSLARFYQVGFGFVANGINYGVRPSSGSGIEHFEAGGKRAVWSNNNICPARIIRTKV